MPVLSRAASFATAVSAAGVALWASAASTPNYPLYAATWNLAPWVLAAMFAVYPVTLIPVLLVLGNLSDHIGRRPAFAAGLALIGLAAPTGQRGAALSAGYLIAYAVQAATAIGLGAVATLAGFQLAVDIALPVILALALAAASLAIAGRRDLRPVRARAAEHPVKPTANKGVAPCPRS